MTTLDSTHLNHSPAVQMPRLNEPPANWQPGDQLIVPPPATKEAADKRPFEGFETLDWYFSKTDQP